MVAWAETVPEFARSVLKPWWTRTFGGVFAVLSGADQVIEADLIPPWDVTVFILGVTLFVAAVTAFHGLRIERDELLDKLNPPFSLEIGWPIIEKTGGPVLLGIPITNLGVVDEFEARCMSVGELPKVPVPFHLGWREHDPKSVTIAKNETKRVSVGGLERCNVGFIFRPSEPAFPVQLRNRIVVRDKLEIELSITAREGGDQRIRFLIYRDDGGWFRADRADSVK